MILTVFSHKKIDSSALALYALKEYSALVGKNFAPVGYRHRDDGSPYFDCEGAPFVSLSHSGEYAAAAVSESAVGIDIQLHTDVDCKKISDRFNMKTTDRQDFFDKFAAAEAKTKALRTKLSESLYAPEGRIFRFIPGCSLAIYGSGEIFFCFCF